MKTQKVEAFQFPCVLCGELRQFALRSLDGEKKVADFRCESLRIRKRVDQRELVGVVQQSLLLVLAVDVEQARRHFPQGRHGTRLVVDVNAIAIVRGNLAADDDLGTFAIKTKAFEFDSHVGLENGFNDSAVFAAADHFRRGFRACKQAKGIDDNRFSGARFAR